MRKLRAVKIILIMAGVCFIARPFLGLKALKYYKESHYQLIIAKAFLQARPEYLDDAEKKKEALSHKIANPQAKISLTLGALLALLFPFTLLFSYVIRSDGGYCSYLSPGTKTYLFTGRLII